MNKLIEVQNLSVHYTHENMEKTCAINSADFSLSTHEHIAIIGKNGSGKSTLLRVLRGEIYPDQVNGGHITWYENNIPDASPLAGRNITSLVSPKTQEYYSTQAWNVNCLEIILAAKTNDYILYRTPTADEIQEAHNITQKLGAESLLYSKISELSQGQLRIMLVARALIRKTPVLLLDEVTNGLDSASQELVLNALEELCKKNTEYSPSLIMTTHRNPLPNFITKSYEMHQGKLNPFSPQASQVKSTLPQITNGKSSNKTESSKTNQASEANQTPSNIKGLHIYIENADVYIDQKKILSNINWEIKPHQQWAIKGKNGSGKSTLLSTILGFLPIALGGSIKRTFYENENSQGIILSELSIIKKHIRIVSDALQTHYTYNDTVEDIIFCGLDGNIGVYRKPNKEEELAVSACIDSVKLSSLRKRPLHSLSTGQARKTLLARALIGEPSLLLLDEPFSGLDELSCIEISEIIENQILTGMQTILVSHHDTDFLSSTTHIAKIENGNFHDQ